MAITLACLLFVISLAQTTLLPHLDVYGTTPDFYLTFTIFFSLNTDIRQAPFVNWINGISKDLFSEAHFGISAFLFVLTGYGIVGIKDFIFKEHPLTQVLTALIAALFYNLSCAGFMFFLSEGIDFAVIAQKVILSSLYTALITPLLFKIFKIFQSRLGLGKSITFEKRG